MATLQTQEYQELKSDFPIKSKFQSPAKNGTNKSYIAIEPTYTDENDDEVSESEETVSAKDDQMMRLTTDRVQLYSDDDGEEETILIQKNLEFEGYNKKKCCYKCCKCLFKFRLILFIIIWVVIGLAISYLVSKHDKSAGEMIEAVVTDLALLLLCVLIGKLLTIMILKISRACVDNTRGVFYIKDIYYRLFVTIVAYLWLIEDQIIYNMFSVKFGPMMIAIAITSSVFLFTHILIRYVILSRYFIKFFGRKSRQLRADIAFIKIMLNAYDKKAPFNVAFGNFLLDFPPADRTTNRHKNSVSFKFHIDRETDEDLYTIEFESGAEPKVIKDDKLKSVCGAVSNVIMEQLHQRKIEISSMPKYMNKMTTHENEFEKKKSSWSKQKGKLNLLDTENADTESLKLNTKHYSFHPDPSHLSDDVINEDIFMAIFKEYNHPNKSLLCELGQLAWKKFTNNGYYRHINATILKANLYKIMTDLLNLKQCIDSYVDIINNLQLVTDIITPILLLFVYLRLLGFDFSEAIAIYVSCFAIIGFFGSAYFSSLFISMSFIVATNPFLVGDYIMYENEVYLVKHISLLSCTCTQMSNRYCITFQNKQLSESSVPIINFTRSGKQKYKWTVYFKIYDIDDESIYKFVDAIKAKVKERIKYHSTDEKTLEKSFCTKEELEDIQWWTIKAKIYELDIFGRKKVKVQMKYFQYSSHVQTLCFNCVTAVMKDFNIAAEPLPIFYNPVCK